MPSLVDFLLQRIEEDEQTAEKAERYGSAVWYGNSYQSGLTRLAERFEPARVLAECRAKRAIIAQVSDVKWGGYAVRDVILELLAAPFAGHPDYPLERTR
jgi:hypothetical protein